ncbi:MAG: 5-carboxymethyl-2-hydroxymuconate Delta-isomerase [Acidobacteria bacterium]|nr:5-carboxymethyl-2-hydroxymuconate Delta-isomerase [Acidobacteriota bacterium]
MPHLTIEYSANLEPRLAVQRLVDCLHEAAIETGVFPLGGIRTRAAARSHFRVADGDPANAFVHVELRIAAGRDEATRERAGQHVFAALTEALGPIAAVSPLAISFELQEITPAWSARLNNIHDLLARKKGGSS